MVLSATESPLNLFVLSKFIDSIDLISVTISSIVKSVTNFNLVNTDFMGPLIKHKMEKWKEEIKIIRQKNKQGRTRDCQVGMV